MTLHRHHRKRRSQGGDDSEANVLMLTPDQHEWVHRNPKLAYEIGWLVHSWENPAEVAVSVSPEEAHAMKNGEAGVTERGMPSHQPGAPVLGSAEAPRSVTPGDCPTCGRRIPHPKKPTSPTTKPVSYRVPLDELEAHRDVLDTAAKFLGVAEQPFHAFKTISLALALVLQDEALRGFGQRGRSFPDTEVPQKESPQTISGSAHSASVSPGESLGCES